MSIKTVDLALQLVDFHLDRVAEELPEESPVLKHLARAVIALCEARESVQELQAAGPGAGRARAKGIKRRNYNAEEP